MTRSLGAGAWRALPLVLGIAVAASPVLASFARVAPGWTPTGDVAVLVVRAGDLGGRHTPLVGLPSTATTAGEVVHHPGPLELWLVGAGRVVWDGRLLALLLVVAVNLVSVVAAVLWAHRAWGRAGMALAAVTVASVGWSLRGEILASPFNPYAGVLPLAAYLVALLAARARARGALVGAVLTGSWAAQCHLAYLGPVLGALLAAALLGHRDLRAGWRSGRRLLPLAILAACWSGPLLDVAVHRGGNPRALLTREAGDPLGLRTALRVWANALAPRPVFAQAGADPFSLLGHPTAAQWLLAGALLAAGGVVAVRRHRDAVGSGAAVALGALVVATLLTALLPDLTFNSLALHNYLAYWPVTALLWTVVGVAAAQAIAARWPNARRARPALVPGLLAAGTVVAAAALGPPHRALLTAEREQVRAVGPKVVASVDHHGRYFVEIDPEFDVFGLESGIAADLDRAGAGIVVPPRWTRNFGGHRTTGPVDGRIVTVLDGTSSPGGAAELLARAEVDAPGGGPRQVSVYLVRDPGAAPADGTVAPS